MEMVIFPRTYAVIKDDSGGRTAVTGRGQGQPAQRQAVPAGRHGGPIRTAQGRRPAQQTGDAVPHALLVELSLNGDSSGDARVAREVLDMLAESQGDVPYSLWLKSPPRTREAGLYRDNRLHAAVGGQAGRPDRP